MITITGAENSPLYSTTNILGTPAQSDSSDNELDVEGRAAESTDSQEAVNETSSYESSADQLTNVSESVVESPTIEKENTESVKLSTRAEKIQKLNEEFFPGGPSTVSITPEFIQRLKEYELISPQAAQSLGAAASSSGSEENSITQITNAIDDVAAKLKQQDPQSSLIETLAKSKEVIENFGISSAPNDHDIKGLLAEITEYRQSQKGAWLDEIDHKHLDQLELALNVAEQMGSQDGVSEKIAQYVNIYNDT